MKLNKFVAVLLVSILLCNVFASAIDVPDVNAKAAIVIDAKDGHVIYDKNAETRQYPASITKLMTALLVVENVADLNQVITANESAFKDLSDAGSSVGIKAGEEMSVDNLLICLLVASANEAANILAEHVSGDIESFVDLMNSRAAELGLTNTNFANTSGLHDENHYTTAHDIAVIAMEVRKHARLREICAMEKATIPETNIGKERYFFTTNSLISRYKELGYKYAPANGLKTGSTTPAGLCLAASAQSKGKELISVVLGAEKDPETGKKGNFVESKKLLEWGFANFEYATLISASQPVCEVRVESARKRDYVVAHTAESLTVLMPNDFDQSKVELISEAKSVVEAPVKKGDDLGTVIIRYEGRDYMKMPLIAADDVDRSLILFVFNKIKSFLKSPIAIGIIAAVIITILLLVIYVIRYNKRRKKNNSRRRYYR